MERGEWKIFEKHFALLFWLDVVLSGMWLKGMRHKLSASAVSTVSALLSNEDGKNPK